jgi:outer membrane protein W
MAYSKIILAVLLLIPAAESFSQLKNNDIHDESGYYIPENTKKEPAINWSLNLSFSDNGFGAGATLYKHLNKDITVFGSLYFSAAKDDREFETTDIYGNTYVPYKVNRMFMIPVDIGLQYRLFREDVTDDLRPNVSFGITPAAIIYTPYSEGFLSSFGKAKAKYTIGGFAGFGVDYLTSKTSSLSMNVRYYYINLFDNGIESLQGKQKTFFGGLYFNFSYNFMH